MQVWNALHAARWKYRTQKKSPSRYHRTSCRAVSSQLRHISTIRKNSLSSNTLPTYPDNVVNFGPVTAEIGSWVWGTPPNFNGFHVLAALLHGTLVEGVSQTAALNRGRHLYLAGWPSRWALAHISKFCYVMRCFNFHLANCKFTGACVCSLLTCAIIYSNLKVCVHIQCPTTVPGSR